METTNMRLSNFALNYPPSGIRVMFNLAAGYPDAIKLTLGEPNFVTPTFINEAAKRALDEGKVHYAPNSGVLELRRTVAQVSQDIWPGATENNVTITCGALEALTLGLVATLNSGDEVLVPSPGFPAYLGQVMITGAIPVTVPVYEENSFKIKAEDIKKAITPKTKALILNSPSNPLGSVLDQAEIEAIAKVALENDLIVFSDEVYDKLIFDGEHFSIASIPEMSGRVFVTNSFSKTFAMTGWRIGYLIAPAEYSVRLGQLQESLVSCVSTFSQWAAIEALNAPPDAVQEMRSHYLRRRNLVVDGLNAIPGITCDMPAATFYAFANIKALGQTSQQLAENLITKAGVVIVPGTAFGNEGEGYIRIVFANSDENLLEALRRIDNYVRSLS